MRIKLHVKTFRGFSYFACKPLWKWDGCMVNVYLDIEDFRKSEIIEPRNQSMLSTKKYCFLHLKYRWKTPTWHHTQYMTCTFEFLFVFVWTKTAEMFCFVSLLWTIFFFSWLEGERFYKIRLSIVESCQIVKSISCQNIRSMYASRSPLPSLMLDCHCKYSSNDELVGDKKRGYFWHSMWGTVLQKRLNKTDD